MIEKDRDTGIGPSAVIGGSVMARDLTRRLWLALALIIVPFLVLIAFFSRTWRRGTTRGYSCWAQSPSKDNVLLFLWAVAGAGTDIQQGGKAIKDEANEQKRRLRSDQVPQKVR